MRELEKLLSNSGDGRVIWTSSITAYSKSFDIDDWQGIKRYFSFIHRYHVLLAYNIHSKEPYESSKWACDLIAIVSAERFQREENCISSFTTSPGVVASEIGALPVWVCKVRFLVHYLVS